MYEIQCCDLDGNTIETFYQWDINQKIIVDCDNFNLTANTAPPIIKFSNDSMDYSISVQSTIGKNLLLIFVDIPNCILMIPLPINISFYFSSFKDITSKRTLLSTTIPVRKQKQPLDYSYEENIKNYTFEDLVQNMVSVNNKLDFATVDEMKKYLEIKG